MSKQFSLNCYDTVAYPLAFYGNKFALLQQILPMFPRKINNFYDVFGGTGLVGINAIGNLEVKKLIYSDINSDLVNFLNYLKNYEYPAIYAYIMKEIVASGIESEGGKPQNMIDWRKREASFEKYKDKLNKKEKIHPLDFFVISCFSFNNSFKRAKDGYIRVYSGSEKPEPAPKKYGRVDYYTRRFIATTNSKLDKYCDFIWEHRKNISFLEKDYKSLDLDKITKDDVIYLDPPYEATNVKYGLKWDEKEFIAFLQELVDRELNFYLSNVIEHDGKENHLLREFMTKNRALLKIIPISSNYDDSSAHERISKRTKEVLIRKKEESL